MLDVAIRVQSIRPFAVSQMALLLENAHLIVANVTNVGRHGMSEVSLHYICLHYICRRPSGKIFHGGGLYYFVSVVTLFVLGVVRRGLDLR